MDNLTTTYPSGVVTECAAPTSFDPFNKLDNEPIIEQERQAARPAVRMLVFATVSGHGCPVDAQHGADWDGVCQMVATHTVNEAKVGPGWLPGRIAPGPRTGDRVTSWDVLALDVEATAQHIPGTDMKRLTGPKPPTVTELATEIELMGWAAVLATSHSHEAPAEGGTLGPRYRVVFNLSRALLPDEIKPAGLAVARLLGLTDCFDAKCLEPARLFYLPRVPDARVALAQSAVIDGRPLDVDNLLRQARQAEAQPARKAGGSGSSVIEAFNAQTDMANLLERHGYEPRGRNRWKWPGSTSGLAGVVLLPQTGRIYSHHSGDPLAGEHAHDAFGAWCVLEHGSDYRAAVKAAAQQLGMQPDRGRITMPPAAPVVPTDWPEPTPLPDSLPPVAPLILSFCRSACARGSPMLPNGCSARRTSRP